MSGLLQDVCVRVCVLLSFRRDFPQPHQPHRKSCLRLRAVSAREINFPPCARGRIGTAVLLLLKLLGWSCLTRVRVWCLRQDFAPVPGPPVPVNARPCDCAVYVCIGRKSPFSVELSRTKRENNTFASVSSEAGSFLRQPGKCGAPLR